MRRPGTREMGTKPSKLRNVSEPYKMQSFCTRCTQPSFLACSHCVEQNKKKKRRDEVLYECFGNNVSGKQEESLHGDMLKLAKATQASPFNGVYGPHARDYAIGTGLPKNRARVLHNLAKSQHYGYCAFCIATGRRHKTKDYCPRCNLYFCYTEQSNHFVIWHSPEADAIRGFS